MIFYYAPKSVALAAHIALEESGLTYEARMVNFADQEQRSNEYLSINPKGRVPALETDDGIITETPAILSYIAQISPATNLAPFDTPYQFAKCQEFNLYLCSTVHVAHAHRVRGTRWADDPNAISSMQEKVANNMTDCFELIETTMFKGPWVLGEHYSICDTYLFTLCQWLNGDGVDLRNFPKISAFEAEMRTRAAVNSLSTIYGF
ncbi:MAG: glutathione S-transferase family protein [Pseudohongiellaceae bacterium]